jgi:uncharacterized protein YerC
MGKVQHRQLSKAQWEALRHELLLAFRRVGVQKEGEGLLLDLLTKSEIIMLSRRILIAKGLLKGEPFRAIAHRLHIGLATIQQVDRWLEGRLPFYRRVLRPGGELPERKKKKIPLDPYSFRGLRARYPSHSALFNLLLGDPHIYEQD